MNTDLHLYTLFRACPEYVFELAGLPSPGPCRMEQVTVKAIARTMDGLITPRNPKAPLSVVEFQFQLSPVIYDRTVIEMASVRQQHPKRSVQGIIFFATKRFDPRTVPWTKVVYSVYLDEALSKLDSQHPLVSLFQPLLEPSDAALEKSAERHYELLGKSRPAAQRIMFQSLFIDWLMQRFKTRPVHEITAMITKLTPIEKTVAGRELIGIGVRQGMQKGMQQGRQEGRINLGRLLTAQAARIFGGLSVSLERRIAKLKEEELHALGLALVGMKQPDDLKKWLAKH